MMTPIEAQIQARILEANERARSAARSRPDPPGGSPTLPPPTLTPLGTGSRQLVPAPLPGESLSLAPLNEIEEVDPGELRLTVQAGVRLSELGPRLKAQGLMIASLWAESLLPDPETPTDRESPGTAPPGTAPPGTESSGTIGGWFHDPRPSPVTRWGRTRDQVLGLDAFRGDGTPFRAGGTVVKNVTGYDLTRLLCGSRGRFAVVRRLHVRLERRPESFGSTTVAFRSSSDLWNGWSRIRRKGLDPVAVRVLPIQRTITAIEAGTRVATEARLQRIEQELDGSSRVRSLDEAPPQDGKHSIHATRQQGIWTGEVHLGGRHWSVIEPQILQHPRMTVSEIFPDSAFGRVTVQKANEFSQDLHDLECWVARYHGSVTPRVWDPIGESFISWCHKTNDRHDLEAALRKVWDPLGILASVNGLPNEIVART